MTTDSQSEPFEHSVPNALLRTVTHKGALAKRYDAVEKRDDLLVVAAEGVCLAAYAIMSSLKPPTRGLLVLRFMKLIYRKGYNEYWDQSNHLFSECAIFIVAKLRDFLNERGGFNEGDYFLEQLTTWAGVHWYKLTKMSGEEIETFKRHMTDAIMRYEDDPPDSETQHVHRILTTLGRERQMREVASLLRATVITNPLRFVEPTHFLRNYQRLARVE